MVDKDPRLSHQTLRVLRLFMDHPKESFSGADIWRHTGLLSGTLYPILSRLEGVKWLESRWEEIDPSRAGRPRRRLYNITGQGYNKGNEALAELGVASGRPAWGR
jgi:PadR family transcriptional regulator, regulatory protein PadR